MKKKKLFSGTATALVTPFKNGEVDSDAFKKLIDFGINNGISALVVGGTTGEAATLTDKERYNLFEIAREQTDGRVPLIFGTGTNDTEVAIKHTKMAKRIGADGALVVTPYYNKGTPNGIAKHYLKVANECDLPIILYNVPSRTGVNLDFTVLKKLSKEELIVGIKEASDSLERIVELADFGDELPLYAGNDSAAYTVLSLGGVGVISVISNALPRLTSSIYESFTRENVKESLATQLSLLPLIKALFAETNPVPIKLFMSKERKGLNFPIISSEVRLPLSEGSEETEKRLSMALDTLLL